MNEIELALAKLDSALGNTGTSMDSAVWKAPTGSPVSASVRRDARVAARSGETVAAARMLLTAAAEARTTVPAGLLDEVEACVEATAQADPADREAIAGALATLRAPAPAPKRRGLAFWRR